MQMPMVANHTTYVIFAFRRLSAYRRGNHVVRWSPKFYITAHHCKEIRQLFCKKPYVKSVLDLIRKCRKHQFIFEISLQPPLFSSPNLLTDTGPNLANNQQLYTFSKFLLSFFLFFPSEVLKNPPREISGLSVKIVMLRYLVYIFLKAETNGNYMPRFRMIYLQCDAWTGGRQDSSAR